MERTTKETGPRDRTTINMQEGFDVRYWSGEFGISAEQLKDVVKAVGSKTEDVRNELTKRGHNSWRA